MFLQYINSTFYGQNTFFLHINKYADDALVYPTFSVASAKQQKHDKRGRGWGVRGGGAFKVQQNDNGGFFRSSDEK